MRRAQGAVEFTLITSVALLIFAVGFIVAESRFLDIQEQEFDKQATSVLSQIEAELLIASQAGTGYQRVINLPQTLQGVDYEIILQDYADPDERDEIIIRSRGKEYFFFVSSPVTKLNAELGKGETVLVGGPEVGIFSCEPSQCVDDEGLTCVPNGYEDPSDADFKCKKGVWVSSSSVTGPGCAPPKCWDGLACIPEGATCSSGLSVCDEGVCVTSLPS